MSSFEERPTSEAFDGSRLLYDDPFSWKNCETCCAVSVEQPVKRLVTKNTLTLFYSYCDL